MSRQSIPADPSVKNFSYTVVENEVYNVFNSACFPLIAASEYSSSCISISSCVQLRIATIPLIRSFAVSDQFADE